MSQTPSAPSDNKKIHNGGAMNGWLVLDKPVGISSAAAVAIVKRIFGGVKAGHGGTLDPLASGILPIALGEATKTTAYAMGAEKSYEFVAKWGEQTSTDDGEGDIIATSDIRPNREQITSILDEFTGEIDQTPPAYSAVKIDGKRAYALARGAQDHSEMPEMKARTITIDKLVCLSCEGDKARFHITCGKGTYIRSLARDIAIQLGSVGHVAELRRLSVGQFSLKNAISLDFLKELGDSAAASPYVMPVITVLDDIPALLVTTEEAQKLRFGQFLNPRSDIAPSPLYKAVCDEELVALVELRDEGFKPIRVFNL
ncbi:MAG: tRNA pseudouridine(55) synthase TruB [Candidatus Puniceispirillaceae bacterium]